VCPPPIAGLIEARGMGVIAVGALRRFAPIDLVVTCAEQNSPIERLREPQIRELLGVGAPLLRLHALEASTPAKIKQALSKLGGLR
jgi:serine kinase of HPr protein (carbohydrate metabolism regulator)